MAWLLGMNVALLPFWVWIHEQYAPPPKNANRESTMSYARRIFIGLFAGICFQLAFLTVFFVLMKLTQQEAR